MALPPYALLTLAELKSYFPVDGTTRDAEIERAIVRATRDVENHLDRRLVYRAPTEDDDSILTATAWANGGGAPPGQPNATGRNVVVTFPSTATAGVITITGTVAGVAGQTEAFSVADGLLQYGLKPFTAVSAYAITAATGTGNVKVGTTKGYIEYHTPYGGSAEIIPLEWPLRADGVIEVNEDGGRTFGTTTAVATTGYEVRSGFSELRRVARLSGALDYAFLSGRRVVLLRLAAGYRNVTEVPAELKEVCAELGAWKFQFGDKKEMGFQSISDGLGGRTFSGPPILTAGMRERLAAYIRPEFDATGERAFDEEAA